MCQKVSYKTQASALWNSQRIKEQGYVLPSEWLYPYFCKTCGAWHLSKKDSLDYLNKIISHESKRFKKGTKRRSSRR